MAMGKRKRARQPSVWLTRVKPKIVVEVSFVEWTRDGLLRHAQFVAVRDDKKAQDVRREPTSPVG